MAEDMLSDCVFCEWPSVLQHNLSMLRYQLMLRCIFFYFISSTHFLSTVYFDVCSTIRNFQELDILRFQTIC